MILVFFFLVFEFKQTNLRVRNSRDCMSSFFSFINFTHFRSFIIRRDATHLSHCIIESTNIHHPPREARFVSQSRPHVAKWIFTHLHGCLHNSLKLERQTQKPEPDENSRLFDLESNALVTIIVRWFGFTFTSVSRAHRSDPNTTLAARRSKLSSLLSFLPFYTCGAINKH